MLKDIDFSGLELVSAVKNVSDAGDGHKLVLCTITFLKLEDSISHLTGLEESFAKLRLDEEGKYIKLAAAYTTLNNEINKEHPIKVIFSEVNNRYRNVTRSTEDDNITSVLKDVSFVESVFEKTDNKFLYM